MDNKEEFVKDESVIGEENEDQIQKERGLLTDEEYMSLGKYDFDLFTVEDYREYHDILIEMPYNWELMKFFHKAYIDEYRTTYRARRYEADAISIDELSPYLTDGSNPLKRMISRADSDELWIRIIASVMMVNKIIAPYFRKRGIKLVDLTPKHIQDFYLSELERVSANTVIHYHANIHKALKYAVKLDLILTNPADKIERPKKGAFKGSFYDSDEIKKLLEVSKGTKFEIPVMLAAFYGLRRSEVLGLKWDAVDFDKNTITIRHTLSSCNLDGKHIIVREDRTKTKSSMRTLPLVDFVKEKLIAVKAEQEEYRKLCGRSYMKDYIGYICVNEIGDIIKPRYLTVEFPKLLEKHGLRRIRFHDLRHSCASLLLANGVSMKQIQEWLGHSDFSTTANVYAHLDYSSKMSSADALLGGLGIT